jgi:hypothetical protein
VLYCDKSFRGIGSEEHSCCLEVLEEWVSHWLNIEHPPPSRTRLSHWIRSAHVPTPPSPLVLHVIHICVSVP